MNSFFSDCGIWISLHIHAVAKNHPSGSCSKAQILLPASSVSASHPPPRSMGRGVTSRYWWLVGVVFVSLQLSKMNPPTQIGWLIQRFLELYYIQMIQFFVVVSSCSSFHANWWGKKRYLPGCWSPHQKALKKMTHGEVSCGLCNHYLYVAEHLSHFLLVTLNLVQSRDTLPPTITFFRRKWVYLHDGFPLI